MLRQLGIILLLFQICRIVFYSVNYSFFYPFKFGYAVNSFFYGFQFDISAIVKYNIIYIAAVLLPKATLFQKKFYRKLINTLFISLNAAALFLSITDIEYVKFTNKRTTYELAYYLQTMRLELLKLIPAYMIQYWNLLILLIVMIFIIIRIRFTPLYLRNNELKESGIQIRVVLFGLMLIVLVVLGRGTGKSGLKSSDCEQITPVEYNSLITNTPFVLIEYFMKDKDTYTEFGQLQPFDAERKYTSVAPFRSMNVVIIILESFSKEYVGSLNGNKGATPFLDSLMKQSYVCRSAFANGRTTLQALQAILCSEPSLGEIPVALNMGRNRNMNPIAGILSKAGYTTSFFYGARNGNLGINNFAREIGFKSYFGMNEFGANKHESAWGVFDHEFLPYVASTINTFSEPFVSCILTLSSHSPFELPEKFNDKFKEQPHAQLRSIAYTDYSLSQFFQQVSKYNWYSNTLFVISADHASYSYSPEYNSKTGTFAIPILYFCQGDLLLRGNNDSVTQQCDILPSILDYLHYSGNFESVGSSIFQHTKEHFAVMKLQNQYQYFNDEFFIDLSEDGSLRSASRTKRNEFLLENVTASDKKKLEAEITKLKTIVNYSLK